MSRLARRAGVSVLLALLTGCAGQPTPSTLATPASAGTTSPTVPSVETAIPAPTDTSPEDRDWLLYGRFVGDSVKAGYIADRNGRVEHRILSQVDGDIRSLGWTTDNHISFVVRDAVHPDGAIWTARYGGEGAVLYYDGRRDGCDSVFHPDWSPDGTRVSMVCYRPEGSALAVLDVATRELRLLETYVWPEVLDNPARWSRDSTTLAYDVLHWDPTNSFVDGSRIATIAADGSARPTYLDAFESNAARPAWNLDGTTLIYNTYDLSSVHSDVASDIFTMRPDGTNVEAVLTAADAGVARLAQPVWDTIGGSQVWATALTDAGLRIVSIDAETWHVTVLPIEGSEVEPRR